MNSVQKLPIKTNRITFFVQLSLLSKEFDHRFSVSNGYLTEFVNAV
jgi:hypothetical protein